ncbi:MAG: response regulator [Halomonadaceae bacterium]|nr:MAG: response regulator [Halomonadaceae bacterium]
MTDAAAIIALVDDEPYILAALQRLLRPTGWTLMCFESPQAALAGLDGHSPNIILSDYRMPGMDGVTFLDRCRQAHPDALRMILSGQAELSAVLKAINTSQVYRFILKPWSDQELLDTLRNALEHQGLQQENRELAETVRQQNQQLAAQEKALARLEQDSPGITRVERDENGFIDFSGLLDQE